MSLRHRVLAADDNPRNLAIIEKALGVEFELVTAPSGHDAIEIATRFRPDVVLLDVMMPEFDGYETCRRLRAIAALTGCKIIMLSAKATAADRLEGYAAGADDYVSKPFDVDELLAKLRVYVRLKSVEEVDRLKSDLLHLLSHETRTPLSSILMPAELLLADPSLGARQLELVDMIQRAGTRLLSLIEKVSYLSELKAGLVPRELQPVDAADLVTHTLHSRRRPSSVSGDPQAPIELVAAAGANAGPAFDGDLTQLSLALGAILDNAQRLSPPTAVVRVRIEQSGPWCAISVTDQGPGIAPGFIDRVFDEFAVEDLRHHSRGHGLGLATARLICEQHGGSLTVASTPGHGATFTLRLPLAESARRAA